MSPNPSEVTNRVPPPPGWRELVWPREHGSWSLALEPLALALLAAPSWAGGALAVATVGAFFARRPVRTAWTETRPAVRRRAGQAAAVCAAVAALGATGAVALATSMRAWMWLLPSMLAGAAFLGFDLQKSGREAEAELAGSFAFAWLPAAFAAFAGWPAGPAVTLGVVMLARAVPTVLTIRVVLRARKAQAEPARGPAWLALGAALLVAELTRRGHAPFAAAILAAGLALRSGGLLVFPRPRLRATTLGIAEAVLGGVYVVVLGLWWPTP
ncbi:YwiC-like family protein [Opitutus sp. ER46]|uniref:YwiC-like family protein n=1 Tax=Opitutus sp. ER46 TaxID=2161864 RepID=UPI000D2F4FD1|nr:YwiC-like family protein [Opitutus sp. ER46]PTY00066.1 hypothetical protein DB354_01905 [Opitutus sp. ER46]